jgi:hypothetical protein
LFSYIIFTTVLFAFAHYAFVAGGDFRVAEPKGGSSGSNSSGIDISIGLVDDRENEEVAVVDAAIASSGM